jgi:capsular polysaccharide biosynthesis protein
VTVAKDELDMDLESYLRALARYWWLLLALGAVGAIAAGGITFLQEKTYNAQSSVYLGQPTDANGNPIAGVNSNPKAAQQIVTSEATLKPIATALGEKVGHLRKSVTVITPSLTVKGATSPVNFIAITVNDTNPTRAADAANMVAKALVGRISGFAEDKLALLNEQIRQDDAELTALDARMASAQKALDAIARGGGSDAQKAVDSTPYLGIVQAAASERQPLLSDKRTNELMVQTVKGIERPRILTAAVRPSQAQKPPLKLNAAAGFLVGLVVGVVIAFLLEGRRRRAAAVA